MILSIRIQGELVQNDIDITTVKNRYDVIVVGLGTAGTFAAIRAAGMGLKVLGIERMNCFGGTGTAGGVHGYYYGSPGGDFERIDRIATEMESKGYLPAIGINPELKKYVCEQDALKKGMVIRYESVLTGVILNGNQVAGIQWFGPDGMQQALAKVVIDCTADAEVCALANCKTHTGREIDGQGQPYSNVQIELSNDTIVFYHYTDCGYINQWDGKQYSDAHVFSATLPTYLWDKYDENRRSLGLVPLLGFREGRFIEGEENISFEDYQNDSLTDQPLFYAYSNIDNHGKDLAFEREVQQDWSVAASLWGITFSVPIPLGTLIPKGFDGILTAGRCIAVNHDIAPCVRMRRDMQKCGEAAAIAAYLAIQKDIRIKDIPYHEMVPLLKETGCLDKDNNVGTREVIAHPHDCPQFKWMTDKEVIHQAFCTSKPGIAIWSAKRLCEEIRKDLNLWLSDSNEQVVKNSALALGLMGVPDALPVLRKIVEERDDFLPETSRKYNQHRAISALYLLGKLRDKDSISMLTEIFNDPESCPNKNHISNEFISNDEEYYFQYFSHAMMALIKIGDRYPEERERIAAILKRRVFPEEFKVIISFKGALRLKHPMTEKIRKIVSEQMVLWGKLK